MKRCFLVTMEFEGDLPVVFDGADARKFYDCWVAISELFPLVVGQLRKDQAKLRKLDVGTKFIVTEKSNKIHMQDEEVDYPKTKCGSDRLTRVRVLTREQVNGCGAGMLCKVCFRGGLAGVPETGGLGAFWKKDGIVPLSDRERFVLNSIEKGMSVQEIGRELGVSMERVRQIWSKTMSIMERNP